MVHTDYWLLTDISSVAAEVVSAVAIGPACMTGVIGVIGVKTSAVVHTDTVVSTEDVSGVADTTFIAGKVAEGRSSRVCAGGGASSCARLIVLMRCTWQWAKVVRSPLYHCPGQQSLAV